MKTMKIVKRLAAVALLAAVVFGCVCGYQINKQFPQQVKKSYALGEVIPLGNYEFCLSGLEIYHYWDFKEIYDYTDIVGLETMDDIDQLQMIVLDATVKNTTNEVQQIPLLFYITLENAKTGYSTQGDIYTARSYYDEDLSLYTQELQPGEERQAKLFYSLPVDENELLHCEDYQLILKVYPERIYVPLG